MSIAVATESKRQFADVCKYVPILGHKLKGPPPKFGAIVPAVSVPPSTLTTAHPASQPQPSASPTARGRKHINASSLAWLFFCTFFLRAF